MEMPLRTAAGLAMIGLSCLAFASAHADVRAFDIAELPSSGRTVTGLRKFITLAPAPMVEDLPTGYYLENFNFLLDFVEQHYTDLLTKEEKAYRENFQNLSLDAQRLYVRLTGRRGPLFRLDKLVYDEIRARAACLQAKGYTIM